MFLPVERRRLFIAKIERGEPKETRVNDEANREFSG